MDILTSSDIKSRLANLNKAWAAMGDDYLVRSFQTGTFAKGVELVNHIAKIADDLNHHPDITLTYPEVEVRVSTHDVAGITKADFELAARIDALSHY